jgi:hypothetical protein
MARHQQRDLVGSEHVVNFCGIIEIVDTRQHREKANA